MRYWAVLYLLLFSLPIYAQGQASRVVDLSVPNVKAQLAYKIAYFQDTTSKMDLQTVLAHFEREKKILPTNQANFYQSTASFWFKLDVRHKKFQTENWVIEIPYPSLDYVDFYYQDKQGIWHTQKGGDKILFHEKRIKTKNSAFKLIFHADSVHTFYIRVKTGGVLQIPFNFQENDAFYLQNTYEEALIGIFYGIMLALSLYNLFLFFVLYDRAYIWYAAYMLLAIVFTASLIGHTFQYFFFNAPELIEPCLVVSGACMMFSLSAFTQTFLHTKKNILYGNWAINIVKTLTFLDILLYAAVGYTAAVGLLNPLAILTTIIILVVSIYATYKKFPAAYFLTLAFVGVFIGTLIYALMQRSYLPHNLFTVHAARFGLGLQGLIFSLALADRYKQLRKQLLDQEREANETLEDKVKVRTEELQLLHKELITQNEELQQTQEEILAQRDAIEYKNKELATQNAQIQNSIRAAKTIQKAIVPYQQKREELLQDYFVIYRPRDVVSGDFYWLNKIDNSIFLSVIDCTGHGVPGAFMTLITNNLLDKIIRVWNIHNPSDILNRLHEEIEVVLRQKETTNNYGMDMCILVMTPQENNTHKIVFAGAKQNVYYIPNDQNNIHTLQGNRKSIGGLQRADITFGNQEIVLEKGSMLYLTSDGYIDQNNFKRKRIGEKNFTTLLTEICAENMNAQKQMLIKYLYNHMQNTVQRDDILVIGVKL